MPTREENQRRTAESVRDGFGGDLYRRRDVSPGVYQCGCAWTHDDAWGDVLVECAIHRAATVASVGAPSEPDAAHCSAASARTGDPQEADGTDER